MLRIGACVILLVGGAATAGDQPAGCRSEHALSETVTEFRSAGESVVEALLWLGRENQLCFGVESVDDDLMKPAIELHVRNEPLSKVVRALLAAADNYEASEQDGIIRIRHRGTAVATLLDYRVRQGTEVQTVSNVLRMTLISQVHPEIKGFAGNYSSGDPSDVVGPFDETDCTLRELLNLIVMNSQGGMWIAKASPFRGGELPQEPFWVILQYSSPIERNLVRMRRIAERLRSRWP